MKQKFFLSILFIGSILLTGCSEPVETKKSDKFVVFNIQIDKKVFSNKGDLDIRILNDEQIKLSEKTANCVVSFDVATQKEAVTCPSGVEYKEIIPEIFTFKIADIKGPIVIKSNSIKAGQKYSLNISGLSSDNCNTASVGVEKTADAEQENIKNLQWVVTGMACAEATPSIIK
jgi:hypothetical protein